MALTVVTKGQVVFAPTPMAAVYSVHVRGVVVVAKFVRLTAVSIAPFMT
jgi:hypothetical protein